MSRDAPKLHNRLNNNECTRMSSRIAIEAFLMDKETNKRCLSRFKWLKDKVRHNLMRDCVKFRRFKIAN